MRSAILAVVVAGLLSTLPAPAKDKDKEEKGSGDATVLATVNGEPITKDEWSVIMKADQWYAQSLRTKPGYQEKMQGKPNEDFFFTEEVVKIRAMAQRYKDALPQMKSAIDAVNEKVKAGEDFAALAKQYSQDGSAASGGDLGALKEFHELTFPFNRIAMGLKQGETSEPFLTIFGYHIVKVERIQPPADNKGKKVQVRHILIRFPSSNAKNEADSLASQVKVEVLDKAFCKKIPSYCRAEG